MIEEKKKKLSETLRVILSDKKIGDLDEDQIEIYDEMSEALSRAYGREILLPEARAKLDFIIQLDMKREELEERTVILSEDALESYELARKQLIKDPQYVSALQRGIDKVRELMDDYMQDPQKAVLKVTFSNETRKIGKEEAQSRNVPEESTEFTGISIVTIVLDSGKKRIF